jgi:hypothetical protein
MTRKREEEPTSSGLGWKGWTEELGDELSEAAKRASDLDVANLAISFHAPRDASVPNPG